MNDPFQNGLAAVYEALVPKARAARKPGASRRSLEKLAACREEKPAARAKPGAARQAAAPPPPAKLAEERPAPAAHPGLDALREEALRCTLCPHLVRSRRGVVFGVGNPSADLMFVGEAPGADEDRTGEPFVGRAGQLLTKMIAAMGLSREEVYIANVLKCRPDMPANSTGNRKPRPEEMATCLPWLQKQVALVKPKAVVALGATAAEGLLGATEPIGRLRGNWLEFRGIPALVTYHPSYLLRNGSITEKRKVWEDLLLVMEQLGLPISSKQRRFFT